MREHQQVDPGRAGHVVQRPMAAFARPGFDAVTACGRSVQARAGEAGAKRHGRALTVGQPVIRQRMQPMVDMQRNDPLLPGCGADGGMQQYRRIQAAAEGDRYAITGSWCRRNGHRPAGARSDDPAIRLSSGR
mmetsp:Transcript_44566/g.104734  ORF Transcript_44566/g.104734 Transcript_44566/m.104734 type:complete len:133 (-) Transcript_44566:1182-1580(-)